jgi:hypothetical protein
MQFVGKADAVEHRTRKSSAFMHRGLRRRGLRSRIHQRASRGHALSKAQQKANRQKSKMKSPFFEVPIIRLRNNRRSHALSSVAN